MEPDCSSPHSQTPTTCPYPGQKKFSPCFPTPFLEDPFNIIIPSTLRSYTWSLSSNRSTNENLLRTSPVPIRATFPANLIILDFITLIIFG